ncbi:DeoR/GlpR family DNA-binding transcription regulator [Falsihalocynthiibacter sp. SS001]|uniref:DeoR/GlpR family DNA-binding transcription regulator n=1 Tax=Falsihalocynthiibacter sp. SS001 TaxID=3349698 RepID=UPI0036D3B6B4
MATDRHSELLSMLLERGQLPVQELAEALNASIATVRRDLIELEKLGRIERLHGSARIATAAHKEVAFASRELVNLPAKRAIAVRAAQELKPDASVFLDSSTTVLQLARHIAALDRSTRVFTNSLGVAQELSPFTHIETTLIGGRIRPENLSLVGPITRDALENLWVDQLFLGATAIDDEGCLSSLDPDEAAINSLMIRRAERAFILADQSKFSTRATHSVARLAQNQTIIADAPAPLALRKYARSCNLTIISASKPETVLT